MGMNPALSRRRGERWLTTAPQITMLPLRDSRPPRPLTWAEQGKLFRLHGAVRLEVREIREALEKIKDEGSDWNKSLQTLGFEAREKRVQKVSKNLETLKRKTG